MAKKKDLPNKNMGKPKITDVNLSKDFEQKEKNIFDQFKFLKEEHKNELNKLSPHLKIGTEVLLKQHAKIERAIEKKGGKELLLKNPNEFFIKNKIELTPEIKRRFANFDIEREIKTKSFVAHNGQIITPNIKINLKN